MDAENISKQVEEAEALSSIYGEDWTSESDTIRSYRIRICKNKKEVLLYVTMTEDYPGKSPPVFEISAPWMDRKAKQKLRRDLEAIYLEHIGDPIIYEWVEAVREYLHSLRSRKPIKKIEAVVPPLDALEISCPKITHGEVITDRKSIFQGHAAEVHSVGDVKAVLAKLKENKKILNATHNMYAYRIERKTATGITILQDYDEDGEAHAGGRMMQLMQILDQRNTLVIVTRWYGRIQLGPDRFRHINNAARQAIEQAGLLQKKKDK